MNITELLLLDKSNSFFYSSHDIVYINLKDKPEWFLEKFPAGKVPAIIVDGDHLHESFIISDFLDEKYPQYPLYPKDPLKKAKDRIVIETFSKVN